MRDTCTVTNKSSGIVIYKIPEQNIRRPFQPKETKKNIKVSELETLANQPGGKTLIYNYLMIHEKDVLEYILNSRVNVEYWLTEQQLPSWMETCSLDEFKDALDFAPEGTKDLIKKYAVDMPLNDYAKRQAIKDQLGYDVTKVLELTSEDDEIPQNKIIEPTNISSSGRRSNKSSIVIPSNSTIVSKISR